LEWFVATASTALLRAADELLEINAITDWPRPPMKSAGYGTAPDKSGSKARFIGRSSVARRLIAARSRQVGRQAVTELFS